MSYYVCNYDNARSLPGTPSDRLVAELSPDDPRGAYAYRDGDDVWQYVEPSQKEAFRRRGYDIVMVYVEEIR